MNTFNIEKLPEFDGHRHVHFLYDEKSGLRGFIAIHRGGLLNPALGATRFWDYESDAECLRDALRLSKLMSYKAALAGLKYGGAKAVLMKTPENLKNRNRMFKAYATKVDFLGGKFITGTDVGVSNEDIDLMKKHTPSVIGNKVDPAYFTAYGVMLGIKTSLKKIYGNEKIRGRTFAIQGIGKTGEHLLRLLYPSAQLIYVSDIDTHKIQYAKKKFPKIKVVDPENIHKQKVDVFVPCAMSNALNSESVSQLKCKIVAGSANNQLAGDHIGNLLHQLKVLYAPDYVVNVGGAMAIPGIETLGWSQTEAEDEVVKSVSYALQRIFEMAEVESITTDEAARTFRQALLIKALEAFSRKLEAGGAPHFYRQLAALGRVLGGVS